MLRVQKYNFFFNITNNYEILLIHFGKYLTYIHKYSKKFV